MFINCPFDKEYEPLLEAMLFCVVYFGLTPRLATERAEAGANRLDKILDLIRSSKFSIHDLSLCKSTKPDEYFRMNMPFEFGLDFGIRAGGQPRQNEKCFLVFERNQYDLKRALSDTAGQDFVSHSGDFEKIIEGVRNFFVAEARLDLPGVAKVVSEYVTYQGWVYAKKIFEGHSDRAAKNLAMPERLSEMNVWVRSGRPATFVAP